MVDTAVVLAVDEDDPLVDAYRALKFPGLTAVQTVVVSPEETGSLSKITNTISLRIAKEDPTCIIGNLGDDHRCRSIGWDKVVTHALRQPGIAYGDDKIHGQRLPSAPFISARIVLALGWYALPTCNHMYIDDAWRELGRAAKCLTYLPELTFEHLHPGVSKAPWDPGYDRAYASMEADRAAYNDWMMNYRKLDVKAIRRIM